ncbi:patatin-like phospholipase family protein [Rubrivirga marina]|uniref:patatin-like phospholipase family protein n=1 Tax=Rubrivirga marina TaxID=1196024 RepID=UPI000BA8DBA2|nr:patatin-like phospholipase family protein [Rubrivirga marina]
MFDRIARLFDGLKLDEPGPPPGGGGGTALALTGGGARAAYQAGVLRGLARLAPDFRPDILTGVSAGALNGAFLAASAQDPFPVAVDRLVDVWRDLRADHVYRLDRPTVPQALARFVRRPDEVSPPAEGGFLDTTPLKEFVEGHLGAAGEPMEGVDRAVREGHLGAFAITTTSYTSGQSVTWVQGEGIEPWDRPMRRAVRTKLQPEHVLASAALPFFFPAVAIENEALGHGWYGDGGIRLTAPLSPALHLGADKILVVNTRYGPSRAEADAPKVDAYPPPTRVLGILMNAVFLDVLDRDAQTLRRINALVASTPRGEWNGFRPVELLVLRPSVDLATLAVGYEPRLPPSMRLVMGGLSSGDGRSPDWLSMLGFDPAYVEALLQIGEADAERQADEIAAFLEA